MRRTLATIITDGEGIGRLIHDDATGELTCKTTSSETAVDYPNTKSWLRARRAISELYRCERAYHDCYVLCLRTISALRVARTEAK